MGAQLTAKNPFSAWGKDYDKGSIIPAEHYSSWPEGALANRLNNGDVVWGEGEPGVDLAPALAEAHARIKELEEQLAAATAKKPAKKGEKELDLP